MSAWFRGRTRLRADDLNDLSVRAEAAHLGAAGFLAQENGREQVSRNPRRDPPPRRAASPCGAVPAVVTGFSAGVHTVDLYGDGLARPKTGTARLALTEAQPLAPLPAGAVLLAHATAAAAAASGTESGEEG